MRQTFYKKEFLMVVRIIAFVCAVFLTFVEIKNRIQFPIITSDSSINYNSLLIVVHNSFVIILCILLAIYPYRLEFLSIAAFSYTIECIIFEIENPMGFCMYFLGMVCLYIRGFFISKGKQKMICAAIALAIMILLRLHFGKEIFLNTLTENIAYPLVLCIPLLLLKRYHQSIIDSNTVKLLNLAEYPGLTEHDILLLQKVLENKQSKVISAELFRSEGTVRNRLNKIYDILGVKDKTGFITTFTGYEIIFEEDLQLHKESLPD